MVLPDKERGKVSLLLFVLVTITVFLVSVEPTDGQPNYYFKASAPAGKTLPRIGRRSDVRGGEGFSPYSLPKSLDGTRGLLEMWPSLGLGNGEVLQLDSLGSSSGRFSPSLITPIPSSQNGNQLNKAALWRKLFGEEGSASGSSNNEEMILDSLYRSKS